MKVDYSHHYLILILSFMFNACATTSDSSSLLHADQMRSEGLIPASSKKLDQAWARPDFDVSTYSKIMFRSSGIQYQQAELAAKPQRITKNNYYIEEKDRVKLAALATLEFKKEFRKIDNFEIVDEPGANTILLNIGVMNANTFVPPNGLSRETLIITRIGSASIELEFRDSQSNTLLLRSFDWRMVKKIGVDSRPSSAANRWSELRKMPPAWAKGLANKVESIRAIVIQK